LIPRSCVHVFQIDTEDESKQSTASSHIHTTPFVTRALILPVRKCVPVLVLLTTERQLRTVQRATENTSVWEISDHGASLTVGYLLAYLLS